MFSVERSFNSDISRWNVASVTNTKQMFYRATSFNGDLSNWDVSSVTSMERMFYHAASFNRDLSGWEVSRVTSMYRMFYSATSFARILCGAAWVQSQADKDEMFAGSPGSISNVCISTSAHASTSTRATAVVFVPQSRAELKAAVDACINISPVGDCAQGPNGAIGSWDVSRVTDMSWMFWGEPSFNGDISKWDVTSVTDMSWMFWGAKSFNGDISKWNVASVTTMKQMFYEATSFNGDISRWDVSSVSSMEQMFYGATSFTRTLCGVAWVYSQAAKRQMFVGSSGTILRVKPVRTAEC